MRKLEDYFMSEEGLGLVGNYEELTEKLLEGETLQHILGFTPEAMFDFYEAAQGLLRQERWDDAVNAFVFLTTMNPTITEFWLGLATAEVQQDHFENALIPFKWAILTRPTAIEPYTYAVECCLLCGDKPQAVHIAEQAIEFAKADPSLAELEQKAQELKTHATSYQD